MILYNIDYYIMFTLYASGAVISVSVMDVSASIAVEGTERIICSKSFILVRCIRFDLAN